MNIFTSKTLPIIVLFFLVTNLKAQTETEREAIQASTKVESLKTLSAERAATFQKNKQEALRLARENNWITEKSFDGGKIELMGVTPDGKPLYYTTHNADAAESVSTNEVYSGGAAGLSLDGTNMIAGEWDGGDVLTTHQEFTNTGTSRVTDMDGSSGISNHATHVAGTILAGGVQNSAKGMAYNAELYAYDWDADESEMADAAAGGLLISNHSYGYITGWSWNGESWDWYGDETISDEEDYHFGFYGDQAQLWDQIAHDAPYYLIVKSAGNDRGEGPSDGEYPQDGGDDGYDCIGWQGNAKNLLTVGATLDVPGGYSGNPDDVEMTSFSSWGPSDDGRIKPDISANGHTLYSASDGDDGSYTTMSGTSMSAPSTTGSLLLLQEHYNDLNDSYMKAATLKALAIHTADEAGPHEGPDYMFGWGLLNTQTAAEVISNNQIESLIQEETLNDGDSFTLDVTANGTEPLIVTVVWTDVPGTPVAPQLDPTDPMLVNDLDVSVTETATSSTFYPYLLDGQNPSAAAATGVNDVDNVEKIFVENPTDGEYTITINHKGTLEDGAQDFSIIVSGISLGYPVVNTGEVTNLTQTSADLSGEVVTDNGNEVTERGFVYNQSGSPTTADNVVESGAGTGTFEETLDGLSENTTYYVRAYAINSEGTSYGTTKSFSTLCDLITTLPFEEDFSSNELPDCWENQDNEGSGQVWQFVNGGYELAGDETFNSTTESNGYAVLDSDNYGSGNSQDADLITPVLDLSEYTAVTVSFEHFFRSYSSSSATFSYSTDAGLNWTELQTWSGSSTDNAELWSQDLSGALAGESAVRLKWNYTGSYGYHWAIDDIAITSESECTPPSTQASDFNITQTNDNDLTINWTRGDGDGVLVLARETNNVDAFPENGTSYTANTEFGESDLLGSANYAVYSGNGTSATITGLQAGTTYHFAVFEYIEDTWCYLTPGLNGEGTTTGLDYCESYATTTGYEYISNVNLQDIDNDSGDSGYSDFTDISTVLDAGQTYTITATATDSYDSDEFWGWIDWNQDGDFLDSGETIFFDYDAVSGTFTATAEIEVPTDAVLGNTIMRISLADGGTFSCGIFQYGEVEDYTLNITEASEEHTVTFIVTDSETTNPIEGATVSIDGNDLSTNASGEATIDLIDGTYSYTASADEYQQSSGSVTVNGADITEEVALTPVPPEEHTVTFVITDSETTDPIEGATVSIEENDLTTNASGEATIDLIDGTYSYTASADEYQQSSGSVTVNGADITEEVTLTPVPPEEHTVTFIVTDSETTNPIEGATVSIDGNDLSTNASGEATIDLIDGIYTYTASADEFQQNSGSVTVDGTDVTEEVELTPVPPESYTVTFIVTDSETSDPIENATVSVDGNDLTTNTSGEATIDLVDGTYSYTASADEYQQSSGSVTVNGTDITEEVELTPVPPEEYTVTFIVTDSETADPIEGATVSIDNNDLTTNASGEATIDLIDGTYSYTASADEYQQSSGSVTVNGADITEEVELTPVPPESYTVTFIVTDIDSGSPVPGAIIDIDGNEITTSNDGEATIDLIDGTYSYTITAVYYQDATGSVTIEGSDVTEEVEMQHELWNYSFMVSNTVTGEPIEGAIIEVLDETATTDEFGQASILLPAGGGQEFYVEADGYEPASGITASEQFFIHEVAMIPLSGEVLFNVYNEETEEPIEGAEIDIEDQDLLLTDENGQAETTLYYGEYAAEISADGYNSVSETIEINSANVTIDFGLLLDTGIDDLQDGLTLTIYPNPAGNKVTLQWSAPRHIEQITIKSAGGQAIKSFTNLSGKTQELDLSGLSGGVYFLIIEDLNHTYQRKLIVK